jgi:hypothetical protein
MLLLFSLLSRAPLLQQQSAPIMVKIVETPRDPTGLRDVLVGALGLTGVLALLAVSTGILVAGALFFLRRRRPLPSDIQDTTVRDVRL